MRLQRDSYAPKSCAFDAANVQFLRAHLCKSHPVLQHPAFLEIPVLTYIAEQKPICPAKGDNTPYVYKSFTEIYPKDN